MSVEHSGPYAELNVGRFFSRKSGPFDGADPGCEAC